MGWLQKILHTAGVGTVTPPPTDDILTEGGDAITTEGGDNLVLES